MKNGNQSRLNLLDSDDSDTEHLNSSKVENGANQAVVNVDVHKEIIIHNVADADQNIERNETYSTGSSGDGETTNSTGLAISNHEHLNHNIPLDRYNFSYLVFYLLGIATMCPWNFFVTADDYWMYKFRNITDNTTDILTPFQKSFESDITVTASVSGTLFLILCTIYGYLFSIRTKIVGSLGVILACFILTTVFIEVNTDDWQTGFFILTISTIININAIFSGTIFGIAGLFPLEYMTAVVSGQALGGVLTALAFIITLTFGASIKATAFAYFNLGNIIMVLCIILYLIMAETQFFNYHLYEKNEPLIPAENDSNIILVPNIKDVFGKIYIYALIIFLVYITSLAVYPSVTVLVRSQNHGNGKAWNDVYFMPVVNYLVFNSGDYFGRILAGLYDNPKNPHTSLMWTILRIGFVPAFLLCDVEHVYMPTLIHSDATFIILMIIFSISNGFLTNNVLTHVPRVVMQHEKEMASSIMITCLSTGVAIGSGLSLFLVRAL